MAPLANRYFQPLVKRIPQLFHLFAREYYRVLVRIVQAQTQPRMLRVHIVRQRLSSGPFYMAGDRCNPNDSAAFIFLGRENMAALIFERRTPAGARLGIILLILFAANFANPLASGRMVEPKIKNAAINAHPLSPSPDGGAKN